MGRGKGRGREGGRKNVINKKTDRVGQHCQKMDVHLTCLWETREAHGTALTLCWLWDIYLRQ